MTLLDWAVIGLYFLLVVGFAFWRNRAQSSLTDYYLAGRTTPWWQSGFSTMATQLGAISFISAPAFVAMKEDGGLKWLCYEFGVPIGILIVALIILPILHRGRHLSVYEYLENRFDRGTRTLISLLFQIGRGLATAVSVLAGGLIISTALPVTTVEAILIIGAITILYDTLGGLRVVILTDTLQMAIIILGIAICAEVALSLVGWDFAWQSLGAERLKVLDFSWGFGAEGTYAFWPMTLGGLFLYASYYGCDQSQVQRELSVGDGDGVRRSLLLNAFGRFPLVLLYCVMGVFIGAVFTSPELFGRLAAANGSTASELSKVLASDPDRMVPLFVLTFLPAGLVGLIFVGILSALMSSLDSAINSLSAAAMEDFYRVYVRPDGTERHYLNASRLLTVFWGCFCILAAIGFASFGSSTRQTTIVLINAVGSLLYGPILGAFLIGMVTKTVGSRAIKTGVVLGIICNLALWQLTPISWLWWNVAGFVVTTGAALLWAATSIRRGRIPLSRELLETLRQPAIRWRPVYSAVLVYFVAIIALSWAAQYLA